MSSLTYACVDPKHSRRKVTVTSLQTRLEDSSTRTLNNRFNLKELPFITFKTSKLACVIKSEQNVSTEHGLNLIQFPFLGTRNGTTGSTILERRAKTVKESWRRGRYFKLQLLYILSKFSLGPVIFYKRSSNGSSRRELAVILKKHQMDFRVRIL